VDSRIFKTRKVYIEKVAFAAYLKSMKIEKCTQKKNCQRLDAQMSVWKSGELS